VLSPTGGSVFIEVCERGVGVGGWGGLRVPFSLMCSCGFTLLFLLWGGFG